CAITTMAAAGFDYW
nr:immunoglobulin heavy chain junction region [Macaca mulatta]MOY21857.1 immunoglobulin heavy chain junction region [Macaca mulatta]